MSWVKGLSFGLDLSSTTTDKKSTNISHHDQHSHVLDSYNTQNSSSSLDLSNRSTSVKTVTADSSTHVHVGGDFIVSGAAMPGVVPNIPQPVNYPTPMMPNYVNMPHIMQADGTYVPVPMQQPTKVLPPQDMKVEILYSKLEVEMEEKAKDNIVLAFIKESENTPRAKSICDSMEKQYGESWHCVVGSEFGSFARYQMDYYVHIQVNDQRVILFKTPKKDAEHDIAKLQELVNAMSMRTTASEKCFDAIDQYRTEIDRICVSPRSVTNLKKKNEDLLEKVLKILDSKDIDETTRGLFSSVIKDRTAKIFAKYNAANEAKIKLENEPGSTRCHGKDNVDLVLKLKDAQVIQTEGVFTAMLRTDRGNFMQNKNYQDAPAGIPGNTSISAPHMHARTLELISDKLVEGAKVLDVGFGSGYLTTCMANMIGKTGFVAGIDMSSECKEFALRSISVQHKELLDTGRIILIVGDGKNGLPTYAPYDAIHLGAATNKLPEALLRQLKPGGRIIAPLGPEQSQRFTQVDKDMNGDVTYTETFGVCYASLK